MSSRTTMPRDSGGSWSGPPPKAAAGGAGRWLSARSAAARAAGRLSGSVRRFGGLLVIDDTQALGILGRNPGQDAPYGRGGGGSLRRANIQGPDILVGASLAKGFGVPIAS